MERFNLNTWLEDKSRKIVTRDGKPARIICYDVKQGNDDCYVPIIALVDKGEEIGEMSYYYSEDGSFLRNPNQTHNLDLFFADEEEKPQSIEIPFGAFDSEFIRDEYLIPEGCEARIEGNKVIIEKIQKEEELIEFDKALLAAFNCVAGKAVMTIGVVSFQEDVNEWSKTLLDLARKELEKENPYSGNQKQEWSEEDERIYKVVLELIDFYSKGTIGSCIIHPNVERYAKWFKALKDRVQPQQEWSEYDKIQLIEAIQMIEANGTWIRSEDAVKKVSNWLKSIKPNHWKPSEEQMKALCNVAFEFGNSCLSPYSDNDKELVSLYNDIKKL